MLGNLDLEESVIWVIEFFQTEFVSAFVALPDFSLFCVHLNRFLGFVFLRIAFSLFLLLIFCHFLIHFSSRLPCIGSLEFSFLLFTQMSLQFLSLFLVVFLLAQFKLSFFDCLKERSFEGGKQLQCFNLLRRGYYFAIIRFQSWDMCQDIIFATVPTLARIACKIDFFEVGKFGQANDAFMKVSDINEIDSHI